MQYTKGIARIFLFADRLRLYRHLYAYAGRNISRNKHFRLFGRLCRRSVGSIQLFRFSCSAAYNAFLCRGTSYKNGSAASYIAGTHRFHSLGQIFRSRYGFGDNAVAQLHISRYTCNTGLAELGRDNIGICGFFAYGVCKHRHRHHDLCRYAKPGGGCGGNLRRIFHAAHDKQCNKADKL